MGSFIEHKGDLFAIQEADNCEGSALVHCVGNDFVMGKGIAVEFKKRFGHQDWLIANSKGVGTALLLPASTIGQNVFYLVSKPYSRSSKPTYDDLEKCLVDMFRQSLALGLRQIIMPKIGCGLDGLDWDTVKGLIRKHQPTEISIRVAYL